jgi:beta-mannosidase
MRVPGTVHEALMDAAVLADVCAGRNDLAAAWVAWQGWSAHATVRVEPAVGAAAIVELVLPCVDTFATVLLAGEVVGHCDNEHREWRFDVSHCCQDDLETTGPGSEVAVLDLEIAFDSPLEAVEARARAQRPAAPTPCMVYPHASEHWNLARKSAASFGWDWGPALPAIGLPQEPRLEAVSRTARITSVRASHPPINGVLLGGVAVPVTLDVRLVRRFSAAPPPLLVVAAEITPRRGKTTGGASDDTGAQACVVVGQERCEIVATDGAVDVVEQRVALTVLVPDAAAWFPAGHGAQPLYTVVVTVAAVDSSNGDQQQIQTQNYNHKQRNSSSNSNDLVVSRWERPLGLRTVELVQERGAGDDAAGVSSSFTFRVNGRDIFCKGANWVPPDPFRTRVGDAHVRDLLRSARDANMNMIRLWGGGIYERDDFYLACSELGLLVFHDLMFACSLFPCDGAFLRSVEAELRHQVPRIAAYPCLALWCANNETEEAMSTAYDAARANPHFYSAEYLSLFRDTVQRVVTEEDRATAFWSSSPSNGPWVFGDPQDQTRGDTHFWTVWHGKGDPLSAALAHRPRFCSEFGFASFPWARDLARFVPPAHLSATAPLMEHRQRSAPQTDGASGGGQKEIEDERGSCAQQPQDSLLVPRETQRRTEPTAATPTPARGTPGNTVILTHLSRSMRTARSFAHTCYQSQVLQAASVRCAVEHWRRCAPWTAGALFWQLNDTWVAPTWAAVGWDGGWKLLMYEARRFFAGVAVSGFFAQQRGSRGFEAWITSDRPAAAHNVTVDVAVVVPDGTVVGRRLIDIGTVPAMGKRCVWDSQVDGEVLDWAAAAGRLRALSWLFAFFFCCLI